jgi:hypothetical protein
MGVETLFLETGGPFLSHATGNSAETSDEIKASIFKIVLRKTNASFVR